MESIVSLINQTVDTLFCEFNYGKLETLKMMPYCRSSVEKFIFDKVEINTHTLCNSSHT